MKLLNEWLNDYKKLMEIESDGKLAKKIGVKRQQISKIRRENTISIGREKIMKITKELKIDQIGVLAMLEAEKEKDEKIRKLWIELAEEKMKNSQK